MMIFNPSLKPIVKYHHPLIIFIRGKLIFTRLPYINTQGSLTLLPTNSLEYIRPTTCFSKPYSMSKSYKIIKRSHHKSYASQHNTLLSIGILTQHYNMLKHSKHIIQEHKVFTSLMMDMTQTKRPRCYQSTNKLFK